MIENKQITRKDFLKGMGYTAASVVAVGSLGGILTGCSTPADVDTNQSPEWPFTYKKIDPAVAEQKLIRLISKKVAEAPVLPMVSSVH